MSVEILPIGYYTVTVTTPEVYTIEVVTPETYTVTVVEPESYSIGITGTQGPPGAQGLQGIPGAAGPNQVTTSTATNITGVLKGNGSTVAQAIDGTDYNSQNLQSVTTKGNTTSNDIVVSASGFQSVISNDSILSINTANGKYSSLDPFGYIGLGNGTVDSFLGNANVVNPLVTLEFPNKPTGTYTIATTEDGAGIRSGISSGTDTYTVTIPNITGYNTNDAYLIKFSNANTGPATLNVNSLGAKNIFKSVNVALSSADIKAGQELIVVYDGTNFQAIGLAPTKAEVGLGNVDNTSDANKPISTATQTALNAKQDSLGYTPVNKAGDTMTGDLILNANPTVALGAATKDYVDTLINGIDWKASVQVATVAALPAYGVTGSGQILTGSVNGAIPTATTDGRAALFNERILVKNETSTLAPNNGIYVVSQVGSGTLPFILTRAQDANTSLELAEATLSVNFGNTLSNTQWHCNPASLPITIGSTNILFAQIGSGVYTNGAGLALSGNVFSIANNGVTDAMIQSAATWNAKQDALGYTPPNGYYQNTTPTGTIPLESIWVHSDTGIQYIYINDGNSNQWVQSTLPLGPQGPQGANGTNTVNSLTATTFSGLLKGNGSTLSATTVGAELGYTAENVANKENVTLDNSSTKYPTNNLVKTSLDSFADDVDYAIMTNQRILFNF